MTMSMGLLDVQSEGPTHRFDSYIRGQKEQLENDLKQIHYKLGEAEVLHTIIEGPLERVSRFLFRRQDVSGY